MNSNTIKFDEILPRLRVFKDGDAFCITLDDFVDLQESPAVFLDADSWQGKILSEWWQATPLIHLPLVECARIIRELLRIRG